MSTELTPEPLIRVMALHALAYCERLFYLEEVEEIRIADAAVYAGRRSMKNSPPMKAKSSVSSWKVKPSAFAAKSIVCAVAMVV